MYISTLGGRVLTLVLRGKVLGLPIQIEGMILLSLNRFEPERLGFGPRSRRGCGGTDKLKLGKEIAL